MSIFCLPFNPFAYFLVFTLCSRPYVELSTVKQRPSLSSASIISPCSYNKVTTISVF